MMSLVITIVTLGTLSPLSEKGVRAKVQVLGLLEFIRRAKREEIAYATREIPAQTLFESVLPYAVAFGLADDWTSSFEGIDLLPPVWYEPSDPSLAPNLAFSWMLSEFDVFQSNMHAAIAPPASTWSESSGGGFGSGFSAFGGGGSSGGGGSVGGGAGGGGGDSW
jgi:hypothetical protein